MAFSLIKQYSISILIICYTSCNGQSHNIINALENAAVIEYPVDYSGIKSINGEKLEKDLENELSTTTYSLYIKDETRNAPVSFKDAFIIGKLKLSEEYPTAVFRINYNENDVMLYLCSFNKKGELLSLLKIMDRGNTPDISFKISDEGIISINHEYEDHINYYDFLLHENGVFKRISYSEEKIE